MSDTAFKELARELVMLRQRVDGLSTGQLGHSSLENTGLPTYGADGQLSGIYGRLPDGTYGAVSLSGPTPPTPTAPSGVRPVAGGLAISWDGLWADGIETPTPMDFARIEVYVVPNPVVPVGTLPRTTIESPRGGEVVPAVSYDTDYWVAFACRSTNGKLSAISEVVGPFQAARATAEELDVDFEGLRGTKVFYGPDEPTTTRADLWLKTPDNTAWRYDLVLQDWVEVRDQGIVQALADVADAAQAAEEARLLADGKIKLHPGATMPTGLTASDVGDLWLDPDDDNVTYVWSQVGAAYQWVKRQIGNGAIAPASLVASEVIATGTVSAALLEAVLILATEIIAGDPLGTHARMTPTGFRIYRGDANEDGVPDEVGRLGTETNDYFAIVSSLGQLVASIDDTGVITGRVLRSNEEPSFMGKGLLQIIAEESATQVGFFETLLPVTAGAYYYGPVQTTPVGIAEVNGMLVAGRRYEISWEGTWMAQVGGTEVGFYFTWTSAAGDDAPAPTTTSPSLDAQIFTSPPGINDRWLTANGRTYFTPTTTGRHRFLLSFYRGQGSASVYMVSERKVTLDITDTGPSRPITGSLSQGGGAFWSAPPPPPPPVVTTQQYDTGSLIPTGFLSYAGNGSQRTDVPGPVQGWDPSGYNGDGGGFWWWTLPSITGTVNRVDFYCYSYHWYYNSGGTAILNLIPGGVGNDFMTRKLRGDWHVGGYPKGGGKWVTLPADWFPQFKNVPPNGGPRAIGVTVGRSGGTNVAYYGKFDVARLRVWYTQ